MQRINQLLFLLCLASVHGFGVVKQSPFHYNSRSSFVDLKPAKNYSPVSPGNWPLRADSSEGEGQNVTIKEMAWFLTTLLLQVVLAEIAKGEGESKISMDELQKLEGVLAAQAESTESIAQDEEKIQQQELTEEEEISSIQLIEEPTEEAIEEAIEEPVEEEVQEENDEIVAEEETIGSKDDEIKPSEESEDVPTVEEESTVVSGIDTSKDVLPTEAQEDAELEVTKETPTPNGIARIPSVISRAFGRSLEVVTSVPPLRPTSMPKATVSSTAEEPDIDDKGVDEETADEAS